MLILSTKINDFPYIIIKDYLLVAPVNHHCTCQHAVAASRQVLSTEILVSPQTSHAGFENQK